MTAQFALGQSVILSVISCLSHNGRPFYLFRLPRASVSDWRLPRTYCCTATEIKVYLVEYAARKRPAATLFQQDNLRFWSLWRPPKIEEDMGYAHHTISLVSICNLWQNVLYLSLSDVLTDEARRILPFDFPKQPQTVYAEHPMDIGRWHTYQWPAAKPGVSGAVLVE